MEEIIQSRSTTDTENAGRHLAEIFRERGMRSAAVALYGEMGVGKTAFTRGFAAALGVRGVKSPTYTVVNEYRGAGGAIFHFDLYRLEDEDDLCSVGFDDYLAREGFLLAEWPERAGALFPADAVHVTIERTDGGDGRQITLSFPDGMTR